MAGDDCSCHCCGDALLNSSLAHLMLCLLALTQAEPCPTSAGDPITTFNGVSTRYWLPENIETELFRQGEVAVFGTAGRTPGYNLSTGEWLRHLSIVKDGTSLLTVDVNHTTNLRAVRHDEAALKALIVRVGSEPLTASTGKIRSGALTVSTQVDMGEEVPVEPVHVLVGDKLGLVIRSSVARKFV